MNHNDVFSKRVFYIELAWFRMPREALDLETKDSSMTYPDANNAKKWAIWGAVAGGLSM